MIYQNFQAYSDIAGPVRAIADIAAGALGQSMPGLSRNAFQRAIAGLCQLVARAGLSHRQPAFGIDSVNIHNRTIAVRETAVHLSPFCTLLHLKKDLVVSQPRVLLVAPMSGHFATLLRGTAQTLLVDHDVYITDWHNARDVGLQHGSFDFDDFIEHLITFLQVLGPGAHVVGVCQPCVAVLATAAIMAEDGDPAQPRSMTLMAGPIDTRVNPTEVNRLATSRPIEWFERHLIGIVPLRFCHLANGDDEKAEAIQAFYDEYCAVMDLPAEFYLQTVRTVFQEHALPLGKFEWRGQLVDPSAIRRTALFTVEGERDDICAVGQTLAAQELCSSLRPYMKRHHVQTGVGHYGVFNGRRWNNYIYPIMKNIIYAND